MNSDKAFYIAMSGMAGFVLILLLLMAVVEHHNGNQFNKCIEVADSEIERVMCQSRYDY